jgi:heme/copper-type cytochrome/quinol oxidase subunit 2
MFKDFFLAELRHALKQPMLYIFLSLMALMVFGATASDNIVIGGSVGNVFKNAPHVITQFTVIMTIFGLLMATAYFNTAALKDHNSQFNEILFSTPLSKVGYFFGRFFGALVLSTTPMLGVFLGVFIGSVLGPALGWVDAARFGPFYLETFINNYFLFILPNMFFAGAIVFALANRWKSTVISFVGALVIIIGYIVAGTLMSDIDNETIGALTDTFGIRAYGLHAKYFTPIEKNTLSPAFSGILLLNRLIWIAVGTIILALSYFSFSFQEKNKKVNADKGEKRETQGLRSKPVVQMLFGSGSTWAQFKSFFYTNFLSIAKSATFKVLFLFSVIILLANLAGGFEAYGLQSYPLTYKMMDVITGASNIFLIIILVFFSGELVWRDRDSKINEVVDATPHASAISLSAKVLSLITLTSILNIFFIICAVIYQLLKGYTRIELDVYFTDFFLSTLPLYVIWSGVMIMIQVLVNNKYIGYFVSILVIFLWSLIMIALDLQTNMLSIGSGPSIMYSDMNGFGSGVEGRLWFNLYWFLFSLICIMLAAMLWSRGSASTFKDRLVHANKKISGGAKGFTLALVVAFAAVGGIVYYNTQVLNPYKTSDQLEELTAAFEKKYKKYEGMALPKVKDVKYDIAIYPEERAAYVKADLWLKNETDVTIDSLHFNIDKNWNPTFDLPNANLVYHDEEMGWMTYALSSTMKPGDSLLAHIETSYVPKGFENEMGSTSVIENGTFLNNFQILPSLGYDPNSELSDKNTRKKYGLPPKDRMPELEVSCNQSCDMNYLTNGRADFVMVETKISTSADQIAISPGTLKKEWQEDGRNYFHYKLDHSSQNFYSFISARFEVERKKWNGIDLEVYYDAKHPMNVDMMLEAMERSLTYYTEHFGPYYHKQCRIIEFPRYASFAQAFPGTMPYSESIGFVTNLEDEEDNNIIDAVIAHEMAHQWWAHQVVGANMQGGTMMSESFAEYSSLMTMKQMNDDPMKMREFLKYNHDRYLSGRSYEVDKEVPLYKVENQGHIHYGKGSLILFALQDYIGEDKVNMAMKNYLGEFKHAGPPYSTSLDFIKYLEPQVPDSLKHLITDWFKEITLYDNRMKEATYKKLENGKYELTMKIESVKMRADTMGNETKFPMNDWVDIGVLDSDEKKLVYNKRVKITEPEMVFTLLLDTIPAKAAIDPRRLLIDRVYKDNVKVASVE